MPKPLRLVEPFLQSATNARQLALTHGVGKHVSEHGRRRRQRREVGVHVRTLPVSHLRTRQPADARHTAALALGQRGKCLYLHTYVYIIQVIEPT